MGTRSQNEYVNDCPYCIARHTSTSEDGGILTIEQTQIMAKFLLDWRTKWPLALC
jgi:hypothetical protein